MFLMFDQTFSKTSIFSNMEGVLPLWLCPTKSVHLTFKFCPTKDVYLACSETNLIKTNLILIKKVH
jgi:hypothetical protein